MLSVFILDFEVVLSFTLDQFAQVSFVRHCLPFIFHISSTQTGTDRHTQTHTDTHRHTQTHTDTHRHTQSNTHNPVVPYMKPISHLYHNFILKCFFTHLALKNSESRCQFAKTFTEKLQLYIHSKNRLIQFLLNLLSCI